MIGGDGINDESNKTAPPPTDHFNLTKHKLEGQGMSHARIARELHVSRTTVAELRL